MELLFSDDFSFFEQDIWCDCCIRPSQTLIVIVYNTISQSLQIIYRGSIKPFCLWLNDIRYLKWRISHQNYWVQMNSILRRIGITIGHAAVYQRTTIVHWREWYTCGMPHLLMINLTYFSHWQEIWYYCNVSLTEFSFSAGNTPLLPYELLATKQSCAVKFLPLALKWVLLAQNACKRQFTSSFIWKGKSCLNLV